MDKRLKHGKITAEVMNESRFSNEHIDTTAEHSSYLHLDAATVAVGYTKFKSHDKSSPTSPRASLSELCAAKYFRVSYNMVC